MTNCSKIYARVITSASKNEHIAMHKSKNASKICDYVSFLIVNSYLAHNIASARMRRAFYLPLQFVSVLFKNRRPSTIF